MSRLSDLFAEEYYNVTHCEDIFYNGTYFGRVCETPEGQVTYYMNSRVREKVVVEKIEVEVLPRVRKKRS